MVEIEWSSKAENDLNEIIDYIAKDSLEYALSFYEQLSEKVKNLAKFPKMGRKVPELDNLHIRELILKNYRIIYRELEEKVQIIRIFHGSRIVDLYYDLKDGDKVLINEDEGSLKIIPIKDTESLRSDSYDTEDMKEEVNSARKEELEREK